MLDYYAILGVHPTAEDIVIRAAYKALAQRYHPDRFAGSKDEAHSRMSDLTKAYEVLADPVRRPKYDRRRMTYAQSVAASFNSSPKYASPALDPGELPAGAIRRGYRVALTALLIVVVILSAFNVFHYSTRFKGWLGTTTPADSTSERANARGATDASVVGAVGAKMDDAPQPAATTEARILPISQSSATVAETATPKPQPPVPRVPDSAAPGRPLANASGNIPARQSAVDARRPADAPAALLPAGAPSVKEKVRVGTRSASVDRPAKDSPTPAASNPCGEAVAALGLCSSNMTVKSK